MGSDFMAQFQAGWQMGQGRNENARRNADLAMEQERQRFIRQQQMEELKLKKQEIDLQSKRLKQEDTLREFELAEKARMTQAAAPPPTAAMAGIPQQGPDMAGPPPDQIQIPQPMQQVESVTGGPALQLPKLFGGQIAAMQDAEKQQKMREALGMLNAQEGIKAQYREKPKSLDEIRAESKARAEGSRAGAPPESGGRSGLSDVAESNVINRLSGQWSTATKTAGEINRQVNIMEVGLEAARRGDLAAGSQAVLVTFQKILDPTSVVRESEYARSAQGQALLARMEGAIEQLQKGGAGVPVSELEKFAKVAREMAQGTKGHLNATKERIGKVADRYKIPRELVIEDYDYGNQGASGGGEYEPTAVPGVRRRKIQR